MPVRPARSSARAALSVSRKARVRTLLVALGLVTVSAGALAFRASYVSAPVQLKIGRETTFVAGPRTSEGTIDWQAAMGVSRATMSAAQALLETLRELRAEDGQCPAIRRETLEALRPILRYPLRLRQTWTAPSKLRFELLSALRAALDRIRCGCKHEGEAAATCAEVGLKLAAHLATTNDDGLYLWHVAFLCAVKDGLGAGPLPANVEVPSFVPVDQHIALLRLTYLSALVQGKYARFFDPNLATATFNERFDGAETARADGEEEASPADVSWPDILLRTGDENRIVFSTNLAITFAKAAREAARTARRSSAKGAETLRALRR